MQKEHIKTQNETDTWSESKVMYVAATRYTLVQVPCNSSSFKFPDSQLNIFVFLISVLPDLQKEFHANISFILNFPHNILTMFVDLLVWNLVQISIWIQP